MSIQLNSRQTEIASECLRVAAFEPDVFPAWEFQTLFGLSRQELIAVAKQWPNVDFGSEVVRTAVGNALNNVLGYPHDWHQAWDAHFDFSPAELAATIATWNERKPANYFEGMR